MCDPLLDRPLRDALKHLGTYEKIAPVAKPFLRERIRETSILNCVIPPELVTEPRSVRDSNDGNQLIQMDIEPGSTAVSLDYKGHGDAKYFDGLRLECYFNTYKFPHSINSFEQMMRLSVRQVIESSFVRDIRDAIDRDFRRLLDAAAEKSNQVAILKPDFNLAELKCLVNVAQEMIRNGTRSMYMGGSDNNRGAKYMIMPEGHWFEVARLNAVECGDGASLPADGRRNNKTFHGLDVIATINHRQSTGAAPDNNEGIAPQDSIITMPEDVADPVWPVNSIYIAADPSFLGINRILSDADLSSSRYENNLKWECWYTVGFAICNVRCVVRIDLIP